MALFKDYVTIFKKRGFWDCTMTF